MRVLQFATRAATVNLASQSAFLFLATPGPRSNFHRLILLCQPNPVWVPVASLEVEAWKAGTANSSPPLAVKTIGAKSTGIPRCWHRSGFKLCLSFSVSVRLLCRSGPCNQVRVQVEKGLATCTGTRVADCSWIHYAHVKATLFGQKAPPPHWQTCPRTGSASVCLPLPFAEMAMCSDKVVSNEPVEPESFISYLK
jgi:hypothetical protein